MRSSPVFFLAVLLLACAAAFGQRSSTSVTPRPILVDVISTPSKSRDTVRQAAVQPAVSAVSTADETEARTFELMNAQRAVLGLGTLKWDESIAAVARLHSQNMASNKFFSHKGIAGEFVDDRAAKLGIFNWLAIGENIAFMKGYPDPAAMAVEKWMQSPSHKKNILNNQWRESAIGIAIGDDGALYFTQVFITR